jgi:nucleoside-diphosphate-sugar epimerase
MRGWLPWAYAVGAEAWGQVMAGRALVTGATGFVGGRLASALVQAGWEVRGMVRDRAGFRARELERTGVVLHEGDVLRPESLRGRDTVSRLRIT